MKKFLFKNINTDPTIQQILRIKKTVELIPSKLTIFFHLKRRQKVLTIS